MNRLRISIFFTRLVILALMLAVASSFAKPVTKHLIQKTLARSTGWHWEFDFTLLDFRAGNIGLEKLRITPVEDPNGQPILADRAEITVESWGLWSGKTVFENVRIVGARSSSLGRIVALDLKQVWPESIKSRSAGLQKVAAAATRDWLDGSTIRRPEIPQPESIAVAEQQVSRWTEDLNSLVATMETTDAQLENFNSSLKTKSENPLRTARFRQTAELELKQLETGINEIRTNFQALVRQRDQDQVSLGLILEKDLKALGAAPQSGGFDSRDDVANRALTSVTYNEFSMRLVNWADSLCISTLPSAGKIPDDGLGRRVVFHGSVPRPSLVIRKLELDGACKVGNEHLEFFLTVENLTDRIDLQSSPARLTLRAQGPQQFLVTGEFSGARTGQISLSCPSCPIGPIQLGDGHDLDLVAGPGELSFQATISLSDDAVGGSVHLIHKTSGIEFRGIHQLMGAQMSHEGVRSDFRLADNFTSQIRLAGNRKEIACEVEDGPGKLLNSIIRRNIAQASGFRAGKSREQVEEACRNAQTQIDQAIDDVALRLEQMSRRATVLVAEAKQAIGTEKNSSIR